MAWWMVLPFVLLIVFLVGGVYLTRTVWRQNSPGEGDAALLTLRERFARGEIDHDEFERRREALKQQ